MKIHSYKAKNFGPFESIEIPVGSMNGIWWITGQNSDLGGDNNNGVGKSSTYDPAFYALTGQSIESMSKGKMGNKTLGDLVTKYPDKRKSSMEVEIRVDDKRIVRGHSPSKFKVFKVNEDGSEENITATVSQDALEAEWSINVQAMTYVFRFGGGESGLGGYAQGSADFHRRIQDALVQADRLTKCLETSRKMINAATNKRTGLDRDNVGAVAAVESLTREIMELSDKAKAYDASSASAVEECSSRVAAMKLINLDAHEAGRKRLDAITDRSALLMRDLEAKNGAMVSMKNEIGAASESILESKAVISRLNDEDEGLLLLDLAKISKDDYEAYQEKQSEYSKYKGSLMAREDLFNLINRCEKNIADRRAEMDKPRREADRPLPKQAEDNGPHLARLRVVEDELIRDARRFVENTSREIEKLGDPQATLRTITYSIAEKNKLIEQRKEEVRQIQAEIESVEAMRPGTVCPTCRGTITKEHVGHAVEVVRQRLKNPQDAINTVELEIGTLEIEKMEAEQNLRIINDKKSTLVSARDKLAGCEAERDKLTRVIQENDRIRTTYESAVVVRNSAADTLAALVQSEGLLVEQVDGYKKQLGELDLPSDRLAQEVEEAKAKAKTSGDKFDAGRKRKAEIDAARSAEEEKITSASKLIEAKKGQRKQLREEIEARMNEIDSLHVEVSGILVDGKEPMTISDIASTRSRLSDATRELRSLMDAATNNPFSPLVEAKKAGLSSAIENRDAVAAKLSKVDEDMPYLRFWEAAFGPEGIRPMAMREMIPVLNKMVMRWMSKLHGYQVGMVFDDQLNLTFHDWEDKSKEVKYAIMSSGMKMRVHIATAFAFRDVICASTGCHIPIFVADEGLESLDKEGMSGYIDCLEEIGRDTCVLLINHNEFVQNLMEKRCVGKIHVEMRGKLSTVTIIPSSRS